jgi:hypothetical protein
MSTLPSPAGWTGHRWPAGLMLSVAFLTLLTGGLAGFAVWAFWSNDITAGILAAFGAIYIGHVVGLTTRVRVRHRRLGSPAVALSTGPANGVRFGYSAWTYYWLAGLLVLTELVLLAATASLASSGDVLNLAAAILGGGLMVILGWFLVTMLRLAPGQVTLSPTGVFHGSLTFTHFVPWHAVAGVRARWLGIPLLTVDAYPSADTTVRRYMGRLGTGDLKFLPIMVIRLSWLASPVPAYHALCFYLAHPDLRVELSTQEGVDRINGGQAVCAEAEEQPETGRGQPAT